MNQDPIAGRSSTSPASAALISVIAVAALLAMLWHPWSPSTVVPTSLQNTSATTSQSGSH
jgi:hypothetical protein